MSQYLGRSLIVVCRWAEVFAPLFEMESAKLINFTGVIGTNHVGMLSQDFIWNLVSLATQSRKAAC